MGRRTLGGRQTPPKSSIANNGATAKTRERGHRGSRRCQLLEVRSRKSRNNQLIESRMERCSILKSNSSEEMNWEMREFRLRGKSPSDEIKQFLFLLSRNADGCCSLTLFLTLQSPFTCKRPSFPEEKSTEGHDSSVTGRAERIFFLFFFSRRRERAREREDRE